MKRYISLWTLLCVLLQLWAQAPAGYYNAANGKKGAQLKTAFYQIINNHTERSYNNLWTDFQSTDRRDDGKVWDMYSATTNYTFVSNQCGNYSGEGSCYNREHSFPKSWFNDETPMYTDLFHLYPTDGKVNGMRSNYPFGETNKPTYTSNNGFCKLGPSSISGYSGTVFEPADEYKGDFARTYFYMATCYENKISNWNSAMLDGTSYPAYTKWAIDMLLRWAAEDPVSEKEIKRNNEVYRIQHNRNPYIDYPGLEQYVWGSKTGEAFNADDYDPTIPPVEREVEPPVFTPSAGNVVKGTTVSISTPTENAMIVYSVNDGYTYTVASPALIDIENNTTIEAYTLWGSKTSETVSATYTIVNTTPDEGIQIFTKVTSASQLQVGKRYLIVCESENTAMSDQGNDIRSYCDITTDNNRIQTEVDQNNSPYQVVLGGTADAYTLYDATNKKYLALTANANKLHTADNANNKNAQWKISINNDGTADICNLQYTARYIRYNSQAPRFACYTGQTDVSLYVNVNTSTGIDNAVLNNNENDRVDVYNMEGHIVRRQVLSKNALQGLPKGIYIIKGIKKVVK